MRGQQTKWLHLTLDRADETKTIKSRVDSIRQKEVYTKVWLRCEMRNFDCQTQYFAFKSFYLVIKNLKNKNDEKRSMDRSGSIDETR